MQIRLKSAILSVLAWVGAFAVQAADSKEINQTVPLNRDGRVYVENFKGSITVTTWDRPEVAISVHIDPDGRADSIEMKKVALTEIRINGSGSSVTIKTDYDRLSSLRLQELLTFHDQSLPLAHYTIQMPATAALEIKDYKSDIHVSDLSSDLKLNTYKGTVQLEFVRFQKDSRFETYKGDIEIRMPKDSHFDLDTESGRHGDLNSDFPVTISARHSSWGHSSGAVNGGGPTLRFTTHKGSLRLRST